MSKGLKVGLILVGIIILVIVMGQTAILRLKRNVKWQNNEPAEVLLLIYKVPKTLS